MTDHISLIARYEGFSAEPFWDYHQWSVGHGSYAGSRNRNQRPTGINGYTYPINESAARALLQQQLGKYENAVDKYNGTYNWTPNERAALISFAYNIGSIDGLTANGTRSREEIAAKMLQYNKAGSRVLDGLVRRRRDEYALFTGGTAPEVPPGESDTVGIGNTGVEGANSTGVADNTSDYAAANNTADLWEIAERNDDFWDNELDTYDYYTYQLELFCVDELTTINFLADEYDLNAIANDAWPDQSIKRITIAMTGGTTEFNIQDLQVESLGTGSQSGARMSGVATRLSFNIIQVGNTSLNDSLQNAAILMGYTSIHDATWFIKVNFIGYENDNPKKMQATKVIPFKLSDFGDLQTTTDARGTSTMLNGTVMLQTAFDSTINVVDYQFTFKIKDTLGETLTSFFDALNLSIEEKDVTGDKKFYNQYDFLTSPEFEEFNSSAMNGPNPNLSSASSDVAKRTSGLNISAQEGIVSVGSNIFNIVADICNQSLKVREALTEQSDTFSNSVNLTPVAIPNAGGLNVITNTRGHSVTYHLYVRRTPLVQNGVDAVMKAQNSAKMIDEIFTQGRCRKRYYYQYTGLNDQILDFQVSLNKQLTKSYVAPTDEYAYANFISGPDGQAYSLENLNEKAQTAIREAQGEAEGLGDALKIASTAFDTVVSQYEDMQSEVQNDFMDQIRGVLPVDVSADDFFGDRNMNETLSLINSFSNDNDADWNRNVLTTDRLESIQGQLDRVKGARETLNGIEGQLSKNESEQDDIMMQAMGAKISDDLAESLGRGQDNFNLIPESVRGNNNFVLIEALDTDVVTNLRSDEFNALIHTLITSPTVFRRTIIPKLLDVDRTTVFRSSSQEDIEVARQRYYEGLNVDISMQQLAITIKGDPFWLNNYIPPDKASEIFGVNGTDEQYKTENVNYSGFQYAMIINNKAAGTDELMNTKIANLMVDVYLVKSITSSFSGGLFTQTLNMVKKNFPSDFRQLNPTIDAEMIQPEPVIGVDVGDGINPGPPGNGTGGAGDDEDGGNIVAEFGQYTVGENRGGQGGNRLFGYEVRDATGELVGEFDSKAAAQEFADTLNGKNDGIPNGTEYVDIESEYAPTQENLDNSINNAFPNNPEYEIEEVRTNQGSGRTVGYRIVDNEGNEVYAVSGRNNRAEAVAKLEELTAGVQQDELPNKENSLEVAYNINEMRKLCTAGSENACASVRAAQHDIYVATEHITEDYLNDKIANDPDYEISPESLTLINRNRRELNMPELDIEAINSDITQEDVDGVSAKIDLDMQHLYVGTNDMIIDENSPLIDLDPSNPRGIFAKQQANDLLNRDTPFTPYGSNYSSSGDASGVGFRSVDLTTPPNTLTPVEAERVAQIYEESRAMLAETPLMEMSDTEYARLKQLEQAQSDIVTSATTGVRGEIRDEIINRETRSQLEERRLDLESTEERLDGWYWTQADRNEDMQSRGELQQEILELQVQNQPDELKEIKIARDPETGEELLVPVYQPGFIEDSPVIAPIPTHELLHDQAFIDNGDGTYVIPPIQNDDYSVNTDTLDSLDLPQDVKDGYREAVESQNGIKLKNYLDSLPTEQADILYNQEQTGGLVHLPGSGVNLGSVPQVYESYPEESVRQLSAAQAVFDNFTNMADSLPTVEKEFSLDLDDDGIIDETWTEQHPDWSQMQDVRYVDANGVVQTIKSDDMNWEQYEYGWTAKTSENVKKVIARGFPDIGVAGNRSSDNDDSGNFEFGLSMFTINEPKEEQE